MTRATAEDASLMEAVAAQRRELAELLGGLAPEAWDRPSQDITVALGIEHPVPEQRLRIVLQAITTPKSLRHFGTDLTGIELRASDIDWSFGSGAPLSGLAQDLALALCGRKLPAARRHLGTHDTPA